MQAMMYKQTQTNKQILYLSRVKYKMAFNKNKTQKKKKIILILPIITLPTIIKIKRSYYS